MKGEDVLVGTKNLMKKNSRKQRGVGGKLKKSDYGSDCITGCMVGDFGLSKIKPNTLVSGALRATSPLMAPHLLNDTSNKVSEKVYIFKL
ncbi:hypothetical protein L1987_23270 [Smallanthus sonchifolius]|uniref:Uncharacterized protein n=1 Tax=Smallanthus sonchifolius TaxID=185202 RepID=A0ACB9IH74_9ASTR|nr:hypothetical protein L1987_23270 [Smallanthus sonchifolius]